MEFDNLFFIALQSSLMLGLIHGINPCGHSWLVLAPFVSGEKNGRRVSILTLSFVLGTALACLAIGLSLGLVSTLLSPDIRFWADMVTNSIIIILGLILVLRPDLLHHHDHDHDHSDGHRDCRHSEPNNQSECKHTHDHHHEHPEHHCKTSRLSQVTGVGLFTIGFINMIIPCPTVAIMYSYALESGSAIYSVLVFGAYALTTGIAIGGVIYGIYRVTTLLRKLQQNWIEGAIMRSIGVLTIFFGSYSLFIDIRI
ncbi:MAG: sulfite exporter TauE/SafE family protein [Desulfobulbaceae bacterium]|uniref:Sulfite exporter TauE/SafE family protein n=1 Tax=Candidatus Desulfatifera sulfidica TaxID=2841691 RepID=A0A8J6NBP4_9BACT|nr:sulfite exporter TauE/SafE family protein [Candidatus Desulfatifera sulfidica]